MVMNFDGTGKRRLEPFAGFPGAYDPICGDCDAETNPVWSPDGTRIAFSSSSEQHVPEHDKESYSGSKIFVVDSDGSDLRQLTNSGVANDRSPRWSPDGKKILYHSDRGSQDDGWETNIWIVDAEGPGQPMVTIRLEGSEMHPTWSPDGNKIAFISRRNGNSDIWVMDVDGSDVSRVTFTEEPFYLPGSLRWIE
jgi:Tol biopolymer transport system component